MSTAPSGHSSLARRYLKLVCVVYIIIGTAVILAKWGGVFILIILPAIPFIIWPFHAMTSTGYILEYLLALTAITGGLLGYLALERSKRNKIWYFVWYVLFALGVIIAGANWFFRDNGDLVIIEDGRLGTLVNFLVLGTYIWALRTIKRSGQPQA